MILDVEQSFPITQRHTFELGKQDSRYFIKEDEIDCDFEIADNLAIGNLFDRVHDRALEAMSSYTRIHCGSGEHAGKRFLIVGEKHAGKSTLIAKLLYEGVEIFGDEMVLLRDGEVVPFPRKLYLKEGSLKLLPEFAALAPSLPFVAPINQPKIYAFDPTEAGFSWRISPGKVNAVFFLQNNHGSRSRLEKCPKVQMIQQVMTQCDPAKERENWLADICNTVNKADTFNLYIGDLTTALAQIRRVLE